MTPNEPAPAEQAIQSSDSNARYDANAGKELVIVTGISGAGKASAIKAFEDLGWHCVDNLPLELMPDFAALVSESPADALAQYHLRRLLNGGSGTRIEMA